MHWRIYCCTVQEHKEMLRDETHARLHLRELLVGRTTTYLSPTQHHHLSPAHHVTTSPPSHTATVNSPAHHVTTSPPSHTATLNSPAHHVITSPPALVGTASVARPVASSEHPTMREGAGGGASEPSAATAAEDYSLPPLSQNSNVVSQHSQLDKPLTQTRDTEMRVQERVDADDQGPLVHRSVELPSINERWAYGIVQYSDVVGLTAGGSPMHTLRRKVSASNKNMYLTTPPSLPQLHPVLACSNLSPWLISKLMRLS